MAKTEKTEEVVPTEAPAPKKDKEPKVVDNVANAKKVKDGWDKMQKVNGKGSVHLPGTRRSVEMKNVVVEGNKVSVWTSSDTSLPPDFVVVNGPTEVLNEHGILIEDPLTALALAIDGVTK
jgi:hypothetical protein